MRKPCKIGTWIRTLLTPGKVEEVKMEMKRLNIDILGMSEVLWEGSGDYWSEDYKLIDSGVNQGANGTALVLNKSWIE
ncbi:unnamed protein product [Arctia plantaginis]|uniref:Uncharacterized protein n=1 Tax=Arctia plantaginis TaxID=874455 RepID=A0A8S1ARN4_ARCPL|nr:unnamed protein product [Arctia plantaginis]